MQTLQTGMFFKYVKNAFPYHVDAIDAAGIHATECRPYWIRNTGTISETAFREKQENGEITILKKKADCERAKRMFENQPSYPAMS